MLGLHVFSRMVRRIRIILHGNTLDSMRISIVREEWVKVKEAVEMIEVVACKGIRKGLDIREGMGKRMRNGFGTRG